MAEQALTIMIDVTGGEVSAGKITKVGSAVEETGTQVDKTSKKTSALRSQLKTLATGFLLFKGAQFFKSSVDETISLAKATSALQRTTGLDVKTASGWVGVTQERGIASKQLATSMATLGRNIASAESGSKASAKAFAQLGISQKQLKDMNTPEVLGAIADGIKKLPPGAQKAALAQKFLGRSGQALLPILNEGSKAVDEQVRSMAKSIGMTNKTKDSALEAAKNQRELSASMLGVKVAIGTALIPVLTSLSKALAPVASAFAKFFQQSPAFRTAIYMLAAAFTALKVAMFFGTSVATGGVIGLLIALGVGLVVAYKKVKWFRDAVNAAFNFLKAHWKEFAEGFAFALFGPLGALTIFVITHFHKIESVAIGVFHAVEGVAKNVAHSISGIFNGVKNSVIGAFNAVKGAVSGALNTLKGVAEGVGHAISTAFHSGLDWIVNAIHAIAAPLESLSNTVSSVINTIKSGPSKLVSLITGAGATGLTAHTGGQYLVGERGPEIVTLRAGSVVTPNDHIHIGGFGGGGTVHTHVYLDRREIAHAIGGYVADRQAAR